MKPELYMPIPATIEDIVDETPSIKTFVIRPAEPISFEAGQFVELSVPGVGEAPFTPSSSPAVADQMDITIMRVGRVTELLHEMKPGTKVGVRGPLGEPYPLDRFRGREILIIGGGCGGGPLRALLFAMFEELGSFKKVILRFGARSPGEILYRKAISEAWGKGDAMDVMLTVDEADEEWDGCVGVVTTILDEEHLACNPDEGIAVMCGPPIMMKFTVARLLERGYAPEDIYMSMEMNMSCGVGKCGHCRIGPYYACKEGPVFSYSQLKSIPRLWEE